VAEIEARYSATIVQGAVAYGDINRIAEATRYHLRSAQSIFAALFPDSPELMAQLGQILQQLELGLPADVVPLRQLPFPLERGAYLALRELGCRSLADVENLSFDQLRSSIGDAAALRLRPVAAAGPLAEAVQREHEQPV
jgi:hypothetical protein